MSAEPPIGWGASFRVLWADATPAGRRRAAELAVGLVWLDAVLGQPRHFPPTPLVAPEVWAAGVGAAGGAAGEREERTA